MILDIYKSKNSGIEYYFLESYRGPYALFRRVNVADRPIPLLRSEMVFVRSVNV